MDGIWLIIISNGKINIMTEDDTFNKLRRLTYEELEHVMMSKTLSAFREGKPIMEEFNDEALKIHGWTQQEYNKEFMRRGAAARDKSGFTF